MGRWGWRLFEADRDLDILGDMLGHTGQSEEAWAWTLEDTILGPDCHTPTEVRSKLDNEVLPYVRQRFDTDGLGEQMLAACRAKEGEDMPFNPTKYTTILMGALIMRAGGQISSESMQYLRALVPQVNCNARFVLPLNDEGFRSPGRAQFLAALDHYRAGVPRSFRSPSCFHCGQIESDVGHVLRKCSKCKQAWYCDKDCQRGHWRDHKHSCVHIGERRMINF